ncbi:MAG: hypothetical protein AB7T49_05640 [Oligoflexales bacterium]
MSQDFDRPSIIPDATPQISSDDLPLVVWLRGDEEYADDFIVDATEAMNVLNIKRSRLTQISGTQLRVARIRMGQHIRPLYRKKDLEAYADAARAPVSHQKSAKLVNETLEKWQDTVDEIIRSTTQCLSLLGEEIKSQNKNFQQRTLKSQTHELGKFANELGELVRSVDFLSESAEHYNNAFQKRASDLLVDMHKSHETLNPLAQDVLALRKALGVLQQDVNQNAMATIAHHEEIMLLVKRLSAVVAAIRLEQQRVPEPPKPRLASERSISKIARERYRARALTF